MIYIISIYAIILAVYFYEYPKMFELRFCARSTKVGILTCHGVMSVVSSFVLYELHTHSSICTILWQEFFFAIVIVSSFGLLAGLGAVYVLVRDLFLHQNCQ